MQKGREKPLLRRRRGYQLERAAGGEGREGPAVPQSCMALLEGMVLLLPRRVGLRGDGILMQSLCVRHRPREQNSICKAAVLTCSMGSDTPACKGSPCKPLTPPSQAPAFFCTPGRFFQLTPDLHRRATEQPQRGSRSVFVDTLPPPSRNQDKPHYAAPVNALSILL